MRVISARFAPLPPSSGFMLPVAIRFAVAEIVNVALRFSSWQNCRSPLPKISFLRCGEEIFLRRHDARNRWWNETGKLAKKLDGVVRATACRRARIGGKDVLTKMTRAVAVRQDLSIAAVKSSTPVLGTMMVLRRPCAASVMRKKLPRPFSRNSIWKCFRSICTSLDSMMLSIPAQF